MISGCSDSFRNVQKCSRSFIRESCSRFKLHWKKYFHYGISHHRSWAILIWNTYHASSSFVCSRKSSKKTNWFELDRSVTQWLWKHMLAVKDIHDRVRWEQLDSSLIAQWYWKHRCVVSTTQRFTGQLACVIWIMPVANSMHDKAKWNKKNFVRKNQQTVKPTQRQNLWVMCMTARTWT